MQERKTCQQADASPFNQLGLSLRSFSNMFGALNRFISRLDSDDPSQHSREGHGAFGFQVLRNKNLEIPFEPWYDFVIGINGRQVVNMNSSFE